MGSYGASGGRKGRHGSSRTPTPRPRGTSPPIGAAVRWAPGGLCSALRGPVTERGLLPPQGAATGCPWAGWTRRRRSGRCGAECCGIPGAGWKRCYRCAPTWCRAAHRESQHGMGGGRDVPRARGAPWAAMKHGALCPGCRLLLRRWRPSVPLIPAVPHDGCPQAVRRAAPVERIWGCRGGTAMCRPASHPPEPGGHLIPV